MQSLKAFDILLQQLLTQLIVQTSYHGRGVKKKAANKKNSVELILFHVSITDILCAYTENIIGSIATGNALK